MSPVMATAPELAVMGALQKLNILFEFQSKMMGDYREKGSLVADFYIPELSLVISVIGEYWHYGRPDTEVRDMMQRIALEGEGKRVIYIDAEDALRNAAFYVSEALKGIDHSRYAGNK